MTVQSIVVGVDFSACSAIALRQALRIAAWTGAGVHPVHVVDTVVVRDIESARSDYADSVRAGVLRGAEEGWADFVATAPGAEGLQPDIVINNKVVGLLGQVQAHGAELVVVGAVGHRAPDVGLGTVSTGVVRASHADVLLVRDHAQGPFRRLVVGVDFSPTSLRAVERAAWWARQEGAELHIVHLFRASWRTVLFRGPSLALSSDEELQHVDVLKRRLVDFVAPAIAGLDRQKVHHNVVETVNYRDGLASYADSAGADLLVVGTRGESNLRDLFLGSTAEVSLQASRCSVLAVKPAEVLPAFGGGEGEADPRMR